MIKSIDQIVLTTRDLDKCIAFYVKTLGMQLEQAIKACNDELGLIPKMAGEHGGMPGAPPCPARRSRRYGLVRGRNAAQKIYHLHLRTHSLDRMRQEGRLPLDVMVNFLKGD